MVLRFVIIKTWKSPSRVLDIQKKILGGGFLNTPLPEISPSLKYRFYKVLTLNNI
jgi:hypothetical protein